MNNPTSLAPRAGRTRAETRALSAVEHNRRHAVALRLASNHGGVTTFGALLEAGLSRGQIRTEIDRGVWHLAGWRTLAITSRSPIGEGLLWRALWESGRRAFLDGPTALAVAGLTGWNEDLIHVSIPHGSRVRPIEGVRHHEVRDGSGMVNTGLRRTRPAVAAIRAAQWARSDRQAATIIAMTMQQRLTTPAALLDRWNGLRSSPRHDMLDAVIADVCDGAQSMGELDFARLCRARGLPAPSRQVVRTGPEGRVYLDAYWDAEGVHVEVQGAQHFQGLAGLDDAARLNNLGIGQAGLISLQIPVIGLRLEPDRFLDQVERALAEGVARKRAA